MPTLLELAKLSNAVYEAGLTSKRVDVWNCIRSSESSGFQAGTYSNGAQTVIAFRGTQGGRDAVADFKLGAGMNTSYFSAAEDYCSHYDPATDFLCGHSLGGAITQVVANRMGFRFATFNAPGVGIFASREILKADPIMTGIRLLGGAISVVRHPQQAYRDARSLFNKVRGVNVVLKWDPVSSIGLHYGEVLLVYNSVVVKAHSCETVIAALAGPDGRFDIASL